MTLTKNKSNGILKAALVLLTLFIICAIGMSISANAAEEAHVTHVNNGKGVCSECNAELLLEYKNGEDTVYFTDFAAAVAHASTNGGTLKMLRDIDANNNGLLFQTVSYTFDFNGFTLSKSFFANEHYTYNGTLTLTDSSESKSGKLSHGNTANGLHGGKVIVNGLTMTAGVTVWNGSIEYNNTVFTNTGTCYFSAKMEQNRYGKISFSGAKFEVAADFSADDNAFGKVFIIRNTTFARITVAAPNEVRMLLDEGYAFHNEDGTPVNGYVRAINNVTVKDHLSHDYSAYISDTDTHWHGCLCGATNGTVAPEAHVYDNDCDTDCNVCKTVRGVGPHKYDNDCDTTCNACEAVREVEPHKYDNDCDTTCNVCEAVREVEPHKYDNSCDTTCNVCEAVREIEHTYTSTVTAPTCTDKGYTTYVCSVCNDTYTDNKTAALGHTYDNKCDIDCNVCSSTRKTKHEYDNDCDANCNNCNELRYVMHNYGEDGKCTVCGAEAARKSKAGAIIAASTIGVGVATAVGGAVLIGRSLLKKKDEE